MAVTTTRAPVTPPARPAPSQRRPGPLRWLRANAIRIYAALALLYLFLPVAYVVAFSFNQPSDRFNTSWNSFTFDNWRDVCGVAGICDSLMLSLRIGAVATLAAVVLGTLVAFALVRHRFRGRAPTNLLIFLPMATPEVVMGSSLLTLFVNLRVPLGFWTVTIAHIMFTISFVVVTVKARLQSLDPRLEQAAMDLYASEWAAFRRVTLPLLMPGIVAAALLAFALSFDDFIITNFTSSQSTITFPMYVWGAHLRAIPPQINVIGALMFFTALAVSLVGIALARSSWRGGRRGA